MKRYRAWETVPRWSASTSSNRAGAEEVHGAGGHYGALTPENWQTGLWGWNVHGTECLVWVRPKSLKVVLRIMRLQTRYRLILLHTPSFLLSRSLLSLLRQEATSGNFYSPSLCWMGDLRARILPSHIWTSLISACAAHTAFQMKWTQCSVKSQSAHRCTRLEKLNQFVWWWHKVLTKVKSRVPL